MSPTQTVKNTASIMSVIERSHGRADPVQVVREAAKQQANGMDIRAAEDALCVLFETGVIGTDEDMNLVIY